MVAGEGVEGVTIHYTPFNQETVFDSAKKYIEQVVNNDEVRTEGEEINWVRFCKSDLNDVIRNPIFKNDFYEPGLLMLIGYNSGLQAWYLQGNNEARELLSIRNGLKCRTAVLLPTPDDQRSASTRPWLAAVNGAELKLVSLSSTKQIRSIICDGVIEEIESSEKIIIISSQSTISIYSNITTDLIYIIKDCMVPGRDINPFCLGKRLIAYGPDKIDMCQQSLGGYLSCGQRSYTATMLSAAKTLGKGLSYLGETVGKMAGNNPRNYRASRDDEQKIKGHRGIVSVLDIELLLENKSQPIENCIVAHWVGHPQPLGGCAFNNSGDLIVTTDITGRDFHIFAINVHPLASADSSVHHLYILQRGDTTAQIHNFCFSNDSRYLAAVTRRGTTHVFAINPYGGPATARTHCSPRVTNERSLFQISAGLKGNGQVTRNQPRLPPFPNPTMVQPMVQIKQGAMLGLLPPGIAIEANDDTNDAVFGYNKTAVAFGRDIINFTTRQMASECLYVLNQYGKLSEFSLDAHGSKQPSRITDETPLAVTANSTRQWSLQRMRTYPEIKVPLMPTNCLLLATSAITTGCCNALKAMFESKRQRTASMSSRLAEERRKKQLSCNNSPRSRHSSTDEYDEPAPGETTGRAVTEWMSNIEMSTYDGPARRLWMGPQFKFTVAHKNDFCVKQSSAVLHPEEERHIERKSAPVPIARRNRENSNGSQTIEVGSGHFDRINQLVDFGSQCSGEVKISQKLQDAINDDLDFDANRRISETQGDPPTDDEADLIEAVGEFDLQRSYNSSQNSLQFPN